MKKYRNNRNLDWDTFKNSPFAPAAVGALAVGLALGLWRYDERQQNLAEIPLAFSEINAIKTSFYADNDRIPPLTEYYAKTNDMLMKIFEASNIAYKDDDGGLSQAFARELEKRFYSGHGYTHDLISEYLQDLPEDARNALEELSGIIAAAQDAGRIKGTFAQAWQDHHRDHYRTEHYTTTECSGSGEKRSCKSVSKTRQVYDYTTHTYDYDKKQGEKASRLLYDFAENHAHIDLNLQNNFLFYSLKIGQDNESAIKASRTQERKEQELSTEESLKLSHTWLYGSTLAENHGTIVYNGQALINDTASWEKAKKTSKDHRYRTSSRSDSGPKEFQTARKLQGNAHDLNQRTNHIVNGMRIIETQSPVLAEKISEIIGINTNHYNYAESDADIDDLMEEILETARDAYAKNFSGGFNIKPESWGKILLISMLGSLGGGGAGYGANVAYKKGSRKWKTKKSNDSQSLIS